MILGKKGEIVMLAKFTTIIWQVGGITLFSSTQILLVKALPTPNLFAADESIFLESPLPSACTPGTPQAKSEFIFTGKGGIAPDSLEILSIAHYQPNWIEISSSPKNSSQSRLSNYDILKPTSQIVEAKGWMRDKNGEMVLVADTFTIILDDFWRYREDCRAS